MYPSNAHVHARVTCGTQYTASLKLHLSPLDPVAGGARVVAHEQPGLLALLFPGLFPTLALKNNRDLSVPYRIPSRGGALALPGRIPSRSSAVPIPRAGIDGPGWSAQDEALGRFLPLPNYNTKELNDKVNTFETVCSIDGIKDFGYGKGNTKKNSHQSAAEMMLEQLKIYFD